MTASPSANSVDAIPAGEVRPAAPAQPCDGLEEEQADGGGERDREHESDCARHRMWLSGRAASGLLCARGGPRCDCGAQAVELVRVFVTRCAVAEENSDALLCGRVEHLARGP